MFHHLDIFKRSYQLFVNGFIWKSSIDRGSYTFNKNSIMHVDKKSNAISEFLQK